MAPWGDRMMAAFRNRDIGIWEFAVYDAGEWEISPLAVPGSFIRRLEVAVLGDTPYIIYHDQDGDMIKCAPGTPPS